MIEIISKYVKGDKVIWRVILFLSILSLLAVYSSTGTLAYRYQHGNTIYYFMRHFVFLGMGLIIVFITHLIPYKVYSRLSQIFLLLSIPLLMFTLVMGTRLNEASRWITLPGLGLTMQTSDFAKLSLIMYTARMLSIKQEKVNDFYAGFLPILSPVVLVCLLILPANFSTAAILFVTCLILMFIGRINIKYLLSLTGIGIFIAAFLILLIMNTTSSNRVATWKHRIEAFMGEGGDTYQAEQAKIAIATGGIFGKGPGNSIQRNYLPHPYSDFIYAIIVEEYGMIGGVIVLFLYLFLLYRSGLIVRKCNRTFPAFLAMGVMIMLVFQAFINMGVAVGLLPVTGQTLPLVSMGGSSMLFTGVSLGMVLSVSRELDKKGEETPPPLVPEEPVEDTENKDPQINPIKVVQHE